VTVTKNGGLISQYVGSGNGGDTVYQEDELVELAPDILEAYGYDGMKVVWVTNNDGNVYLNCAYSADNTIFYPDLVKIKLDANGGGLLGIEAENYLYNHTASRATPSYVYDKATARERVSPKLTIDGEALTLIPTEWNSEIIAYEFHGFIGENEYFVYIDAETLEEVKVLAVIDTGSGRLIS
jgi:germination protein YpeB